MNMSALRKMTIGCCRVLPTRVAWQAHEARHICILREQLATRCVIQFVPPSNLAKLGDSLV